MVTVRKELSEDADAIRSVNTRAFGQTQEADIVDKLRQNCSDLLSLVAVREKKIVGHILFSPVVVASERGSARGMGLAPIAVQPECQCQGIGSGLITAGIAELKIRHCPFIVVLGYPQYYPKFGFEHASRHGIRSEWQVPDEAFMILILDEARMRGISGTAKYRPEFEETT